MYYLTIKDSEGDGNGRDFIYDILAFETKDERDLVRNYIISSDTKHKAEDDETYEYEELLEELEDLGVKFEIVENITDVEIR